MDQKTISETYEKNKSRYLELIDESKFILKKRFEQEKLRIHIFNSRVKTLTSLQDKCNRKQTDNPFRDIHDIVGLRVVCLFRSDIESIGKIIRNEFEVLSEDNKVDENETGSFGYMSFHFIVEIKDSYSGPRYSEIKNIPFEIQIRTISMDAWATISHYLDYKTDHDVPKELRKDFYALSGLFYLADTHFKMFYEARKESKKKTLESVEKGKPENIEINLDSMKYFLTKKYPDREHGDSKVISDLVSELRRLGYTNIEQLDIILNKTEKDFISREEKHPPGEIKGYKFIDVGVVRVSLDFIHPEYIKLRKNQRALN